MLVGKHQMSLIIIIIITGIWPSWLFSIHKANKIFLILNIFTDCYRALFFTLEDDFDFCSYLFQFISHNLFQNISSVIMLFETFQCWCYSTDENVHVIISALCLQQVTQYHLTFVLCGVTINTSDLHFHWPMGSWEMSWRQVSKIAGWVLRDTNGVLHAGCGN